jgi:hypothetical protein
MVERTRTSRIAFWVAAVIGWAFITIGLVGVHRDRDATRPADLARWFVGLLLVHDLLVVPVALGIAWGVGRVVPGRFVVAVRAGLAATALVVALAFPLVRGYGERASNPTLLPLPYGRNLVIAIGTIWLVVGGLVVASLVVASSRRGR